MPLSDWRRRWLIPLGLGLMVIFTLTTLGLILWLTWGVWEGHTPNHHLLEQICRLTKGCVP